MDGRRAAHPPFCGVVIKQNWNFASMHHVELVIKNSGQLMESLGQTIKVIMCRVRALSLGLPLPPDQ